MSLVKAMGYIVVTGPLEPWSHFAEEVLGAQPVPSPNDDELWLRTDERAYRIVVQNGEPAGPMSLIALGFETPSAEALTELIESVRASGVEVSEDAELAKRRMVRRLVSFKDPDGHNIEAYYGQASSRDPFVSPRGFRFVTGDLGVGHAFLFSDDTKRCAAFFTDVLGFRLSDTIDFGIAEGTFLHCNPRHHSIALANFKGAPAGIGHLMLEVEQLEYVGRALDVVQKSSGLVMQMGEHTNDRMTSFYVKTPSGFDIEYGWNGRIIDDAEWTVGHYDAASTWGHQFLTPPQAPPSDGSAADVTETVAG